jgi:hypothetical protein
MPANCASSRAHGLAGILLMSGEMIETTARERLSAFLQTRPGHSYCDACAARALGIDASTAYRAATRSTRAQGFVREYALCSDCGANRLVTRAAF